MCHPHLLQSAFPAFPMGCPASTQFLFTQLHVTRLAAAVTVKQPTVTEEGTSTEASDVPKSQCLEAKEFPLKQGSSRAGRDTFTLFLQTRRHLTVEHTRPQKSHCTPKHSSSTQPLGNDVTGHWLDSHGLMVFCCCDTTPQESNSGWRHPSHGPPLWGSQDSTGLKPRELCSPQWICLPTSIDVIKILPQAHTPIWSRWFPQWDCPQVMLDCAMLTQIPILTHYELSKPKPLFLFLIRLVTEGVYGGLEKYALAAISVL